MFSRKGTDYSDTYTNLGAIIKSNVNIKNCILDGEVLAWDSESNSVDNFVKFSTVKTVGIAEMQLKDAFDGRDGWDKGLKQWLVYIVLNS